MFTQPPPKKGGGGQKSLVTNEIIKVAKLSKMARKLVETVFRFCDPTLRKLVMKKWISLQNAENYEKCYFYLFLVNIEEERSCVKFFEMMRKIVTNYS